MGQLTLYFVGAVTHFPQQPGSNEPHRAVLHNARDGKKIGGHDIHPHWPRMVVSPPPAEPLPELDGVTIAVRGVTSGPLDYSRYRCVPSVRDFTDTDFEIDDEVRRGGSCDKTAAHVELERGTFRGGLTKWGEDQRGVAVAWVELATAATPTLELRRYGSPRTETLTLPDEAQVVFENLGREHGDDSDHDFLLHFLIAKAVPKNARYPKALLCADEVILPYVPNVTVGPGCSNSNYP
jgi:hypothetical protein